MVLKEKFLLTFRGARAIKSSVRLVKEKGFYKVYVNDNLYATKTNELFAVQVFNAI